MTDAITLLGASLRSDAEVLRVTGQNLANVQTPGYRREISVLQSGFDAVAMRGIADAASLVAPVMQAATDFGTGPLQQSPGPWHVALEGAGYFVLNTPTGEQVTRRGDFSLDSSGRLVSQEGFPVLGDGGEITPPDGVPTIDADGTIHLNGQVVDRLRRVTADPHALTAAGQSRFAPTSGTVLTDTTSGSVRQGFIESSNVTPAEELLRLMETMRHFEMTQHFVRGAHEMLGDAISTLGKV